MSKSYVINHLPEDCAALPLSGEFDPAKIPAPWAGLNEAKIDIYPWGGDYRPACCARVGWNEKGLHVLMYAYEEAIRTEITEIGGAVCTDSCVEFFIAPNAENDKYVNCEVNPVTVMHIGVGDGRHGRTVMQTIPAGFEPCHSEHKGGWWAVSYTIPAAFIQEHFGVTLKEGAAMRGNFYKCGDPDHYGMFSPYDTPRPDFHRPEQFVPFTLA